MGTACSTNGEKRNVYGVLRGNPEGKKPVGRPRRRLALVNMVMNFPVP
jgi:hypothetical protein